MTEPRDNKDPPMSSVEPEPVRENPHTTTPATTDASNINADASHMSAQAYEHDTISSDNEHVSDSDNDFAVHDNGNDFNIEEDRFTVAKPVWNDTKFAIFFLVVLLSFIIASMSLIIKYSDKYFQDMPPNPPIPAFIFTFKFIFMILFTLASSFGISVLIFLFAGKNATRFTEIGLKFVASVLFLGTLSAAFIGNILQGVLYCCLAAGIVVILRKYQPLITLAANILEIVVSVMKRYPQTVVAALVGFFSTLLFNCALGLSIVCAYVSYGFNGDGTPKFDADGNQTSVLSPSLVFTILFLNFAGLYIVDVLKSILHVTIAGFYGTWYYLESTFTGMPNNEGIGSFKRSVTYSLGSICMGSLFVVVFQSIVVFIYIGDKKLGILGKVEDDFLTVLSLAIGYFNTYAFSFVALYGVPMIRSARSTWIFFKQRGKQAALNDLIIICSLGFYCFVAGIVSMAASALILFLMSLFADVSQDSYSPLLAYSFFISSHVTGILIITAVSGSSAFFYALNKDPAVFEETHPFEFQEISRCYPRVLEKLDLNPS